MENNKNNETQKMKTGQVRVMLDKNGQSVHKMNINMKNRIFAKFNFEEVGEKLGKTKDIIDEGFKYYSRMLNELNKYNIKEGLVQRPKYYIIEDEKSNLHLIKNEGDNIQYINIK
ncbi:MAG: hypothetical protein ACOCP8_05915 [archaeon]